MTEAHRRRLDTASDHFRAGNLRAAAWEADSVLKDLSADREAFTAAATVLTNPARPWGAGRPQTSDTFYLTVLERLEAVLGPDDGLTTAARLNLAGHYLGAGEPEKAEPIYEYALGALEASKGLHHADTQRVRHTLAVLYRNRGEVGKAEALFTDTGVCEHLKPVVDYCRAAGGRITSVGAAWSRNCHIWVYFDAFLDAEALRQRFSLPDCVTVHTHRGTHDGSEHGLVCNEHNDAVMGGHPSEATAADAAGHAVKRIG